MCGIICARTVVDYFYTKDIKTRFSEACVVYTFAQYCGENTVYDYTYVYVTCTYLHAYTVLTGLHLQMQEINKSESKHFVILFRDAGMQYRGLYTYNPDREDVFKIHGVGPNRLIDKMMEKFYKSVQKFVTCRHS